ncbi:sigma 54-interacting transcriptional regulator, partial [bacterium]|nr:sigma 54-interacting transcriptional regulator [bacterium]
HTKGSFTGAVSDHKGLIETANGGTLFLDEIGELPLSLQVKLLRFLQEGEIRRVGATQVQKYNVRIISATNKNLDEAVKSGDFREDLYFRTSVIPVIIPPLRERKEDISLLAIHLFQRLCDKHKRNATGISPETLKHLMDYDWPGNVRELENAIEYALHFTDDKEMITVDHLPIKIRGTDEKKSFDSEVISIDDYCRQSIYFLQENHTEQQIADILGISRKSLWEKRKRWELRRNSTQNTTH